jgi:hypothetical protein
MSGRPRFDHKKGAGELARSKAAKNLVIKHSTKSAYVAASLNSTDCVCCRQFELNELMCLPGVCQRQFFGRTTNASETVRIICKFGDASPNRKFFAEPLEEVLRRGKCSELLVRDFDDPARLEAVFQQVLVSLVQEDRRVRLQEEEDVKRKNLKKLFPKRYEELYATAPVKKPLRFVIRTVFILRVPCLSHPDLGHNAALVKLVEVLRHRQCYIATLIFFGCNFDEDSSDVLSGYLESEPQYPGVSNSVTLAVAP